MHKHPIKGGVTIYKASDISRGRGAGVSPENFSEIGRFFYESVSENPVKFDFLFSATYQKH